LIYAFGGFTKENTLKPFDKYQDIEKGGYAKFTGLKTYNKNLKTMLAIGGWNEGSSRFSPMVANPERRKELIKNAIKFLRQNHFDGLDLDWEYPSFRDGGKSRDRDNYAQLVQELREEFDRESEKTGRSRLLLTMAVPAGIEYINKGYDVPKLNRYLDWMNILSYDYHSAFEPAVNHHAPLYSLEEPSEYNYDTELNIDYTIQHYLKNGADPNKLVLGIPTYGRSYTLYNPDANELGAPADGPGDMGDATRENGYLAYYEICEYVKSQDWELVQPDPDAMGPYAYKDNQWVGFDDDAIARKKAAYVAENGLGGIMFWSIDNDDFRGTCHGKPYPIIEAAKEALISAYGLTDENLVSPPAKSTKSKTRTRPQISSKSSETKEEGSEKKRISTSGGSRRRNRNKTKSEEASSSNRAKIRRKESRRTTEGPVYSSLELVTPSYTTPAPPSTPDMGGGFKCEDEGFYPHPKDCKKYYWCLNGAGELGIIAHQFTCPAGLYFNKAADSCDYSRNVLCNKKLSKSTTTTTTTTEATTSKTTPTKRAPPKITAATSRTTLFRTSTTTEAYEDEYEYEDEDDFEDGRNSEEDPRVIKELLDLIKKAGGIEQLEKQLKIHEDGSASVSNSAVTTPSSISKSLVERVLGKAAKSNIGRKNSYSFLNRNSRGPQNEGLKTTENRESQGRGRPQYTTITRQRAQKTETEDEEDSDNDENPQKHNKRQPEYVNIRRGRVSTTEEPEEDSKSQLNRNKVLGEDDDTEIDDEDEEPKKKNGIPQYVNIRRQRPSTTEETSTSKYTVIRRGTTEANVEDEDEDSEGKKTGSTTSSTEGVTLQNKRRSTTTPSTDTETSSAGKPDLKSKYKILRRGSTTESSVAESDSSKRRGTTSASVQDVSENGKTRGTTVSSSEGGENELKSRYKGIKRGSTTEASTNESEGTSTDSSTIKYSNVVRPTSTTRGRNNEDTTNSETEDPVTIVEQLVITSPESLTIKTTASLSTTKLLSEQSKNGSELSQSTESNGEGVYQTQTPLLLEPRPFSLSTNDPTSSLKPVTESSTRVTKVSESNYKLRVRQKVPNTQTDIISTTTLTTEKPTPFRTRAPSRYKQTTSSTVDHRTSRPTIKPFIRAKKRFSTTTEPYSDNYEEYDLNRSYRPSEIADLSSLTAVDFTSLKQLNRFNSPSRPRRPRPSTTTTTTQKPEESLKTGSRTLPLARKLLEGTSFGKSRRVIPTKKEAVVEDQINSSSETTHRIRGFTRVPFSLSSVPPTTEETTRHTPRTRKIIRRLRPTVGTKLRSETENNHEPISFKKRLIRPSSTTATDTENLIENASSNSLFNRRFTRPTTTIAEEVNKLSSATESVEKTTIHLPKEDDEQNETSEDVSGEEGENIKLSESNIRENSNVNNNNVVNADDGKKVRRKVLKRIKSKVDEEKASTEPNVIIRTRKIIRKLKPTESTTATTSTAEPAHITTQNRKRKIIRRLRPTTATSEIKDSVTTLSSSPTLSTTEKTLFIRGRPFTTNTEKTVDKAKEEQESEIQDEEIVSEKAEPVKFKPTTFKSKYKTLSRTTTPQTDKEEESEEQSEKSTKDHLVSVLDKIKHKTFSKTTTKSPDSETHTQRTIDRSRYSTINRGTTSATFGDEFSVRPPLATSKEDAEEEVDDQSSPRTIDRTRYSTINRATTSATLKYESTNEEDVDQQEYKEKITSKQEVSKYRVYVPTTFHDDYEDEEIDEDNLTTKSPKYRIFRPTLTADDTNEDEEESIRPTKYRILRPTLTTTDGEEKNTHEVNKEEDGIITSNLNIPNENKNEETNETIIQTTENVILEENNTTEIIHEQRNDDKEDNQEQQDTKDKQEDKDEEGNTDKPEISTEDNSDESTTETITTTVRNYINPILTRQKNRPAFVRPRLTTQNPLKATLATKPRYRSFSRSSTPAHSKTYVKGNKNEDEQNQETGRKFVPKHLSRTRYLSTGRENKTETTDNTEITSPVTTESNIDSNSTLNITTTEFYNTSLSTTASEVGNTTETIELTTLIFDNVEEIYNGTTVPDNDAQQLNSTVTESTVTTIQTTDESSTDVVDITSTENVMVSYEANITSTENVMVSYEANITSTENVMVSYEANITDKEFEDVTKSTTVNNTDDESEVAETTTSIAENVTDKNLDEDLINDTTINYSETSTQSSENTTTETTPVYHPKSSLRPLQSRPKYSVPKRITLPEGSTVAPKSPRRFNQRNRSQSTTRLLTPNLRSTTPLSVPKNRFIYKYSTTERNRFVTKEQDTQLESDDYEEETPEEEDHVEEEIEEQHVFTPRTPSSYSPKPQTTAKPKPRISNRPGGYSFKKSTETPKVTEDLSDINTEAVKNRNKNLFSKKRKMNTPFAGHSSNESSTSSDKSTPTATTESTTEALLLTTTPVILESVTKPSMQVVETTEYLTTLHHIFAETEVVNENGSPTTESIVEKGPSTVETTTISVQDSNVNSTNSKVEKLIEVNRIVEVREMNNTNVQKENKVIDKVGVINRVTVVKVVDGNPNIEENEITESTSESITAATSANPQTNSDLSAEIATVKEIPNSEIKGGLYGLLNPFDLSERQDRKYEIYGDSKVIDYSNKDAKTNDKERAEIIDGRSNINIITPRPHYSTEASTISLEALFQTDTPQKLNNIQVDVLKPSHDDELLETGNSRYINVRILGQDEKADKEIIKDESQIVPVRVLKEDDYITMKAEVVEVTPKTNKDTIKIVPIKVEMSRKLIGPADFNMKVEKGIPKVNFQILKSENK
jgi:chitinase